MKGSEPTQETTPAKGEPVEIPVPTRQEVFRDLGNVAKRRKAPPPSDEKTAAGEPPAPASTHRAWWYSAAAWPSEPSAHLEPSLQSISR